MDEQINISREFLLAWRDGLLKQVDAVERMLCISPRTAELRQMAKEQAYERTREVVSNTDTN